MSDNNRFAEYYFLTELTINSLKGDGYLINLEKLKASMEDIYLRWELEDDPRKKDILHKEFLRLTNKFNESVATKKRERERDQKLRHMVLISLMVLFVLFMIMIVVRN